MSLLIGWMRRRLTIFEAWPFLQCCAVRSIMATHIISTKRAIYPPHPPTSASLLISYHFEAKKRNKCAVMIFICETQAWVDGEQVRNIIFHLWLWRLWILFFFLPSFLHTSGSTSGRKLFFVWTRGLIMKKCQLEKSPWAAGKGHFDKSHIFTQGATGSTQCEPQSQIIQRQGQSIIKPRLTVVWRRRWRQANRSG